MHALKDAVSSLWTRLNPKEPDPWFLATFMAVALTIFAIGLAIGSAV